MTFRTFFGVLLLCISYPLPVAAQDQPVPLHGFEDMSCGAWAKSESNIAVRAQYLYWFRGFVSGFNHGSKAKQVSLEAMPNQETLALYVGKYCREKPLNLFVGAAFDLVRDIAVKK
ncbi:MAG: hypothetical protein HYY48_02390 [Gammaproteobacteria bacterium]|nr:hypothetical protein [Gammaproteobacteria bacterium]